MSLCQAVRICRTPGWVQFTRELVVLGSGIRTGGNGAELGVFLVVVIRLLASSGSWGNPTPLLRSEPKRRQMFPAVPLCFRAESSR